MNRHVTRNPVFIACFTTAMGLSIGVAPSVHAEAVETRVGTIELELGVPNEQSAQRLFDSMDFQRACQAYIWALPAVGFEYVLREQRNELGAKNGDVAFTRDTVTSAGSSRRTSTRLTSSDSGIWLKPAP